MKLNSFDELVVTTGFVDTTLISNLLTPRVIMLICHQWVRFKCPCGCGGEIQLPVTMKEHYGNKWHYDLNDDQTISIFPSIRWRGPKGCHTHFNLIRNKVEWLS